MSQAALDATGLVQPGSLVYHSYRIKMAPNADRAAAAAALNAAFPNAGWRIRQLEDAGQRTRDFLENTRAYLDLIGLSALLIGGLGIANAVRAHLEGKARVIAMLKCVGATSGQIAATDLITIGVMAAISIVIALAAGATFPFLFKASLAQVDVDLETGLYAAPLLRAAGFGALTAFAFSLPSLLRARRTKPAQLFRAAAVELGTVGRKDIVAVGLAGLALAALVIATADNKLPAAGFTAAAVATLLAFRGLAALIQAAADRGQRRLQAGAQRARPALRARDPGPSLGAGRQHRAVHRPRPHVLIVVALIQGSILSDFARSMPQRAPSFYFIDIQPDQVAALQSTVMATPVPATPAGTDAARPHVRMNDVPAEKSCRPGITSGCCAATAASPGRRPLRKTGRSLPAPGGRRIIRAIR